MSEKIILTGRRRTFTASGSMSVQGAYIRYRYETSNAPYGVARCGFSSASIGPLNSTYFTGLSLSIASFIEGTAAAPTSRFSMGSAFVNVPVNPDDPPAAVGNVATSSASPQIITATATYNVTLYLVEIERIDSTTGSRLFEEVIADDVTSTIIGVMTVAGQTRSVTSTVIGNAPTGSTRKSIDISGASCYAVCESIAQRNDISDPPRNGYGPSYTITSTATVSNSAAGCDFSPSASANLSGSGAIAVSGSASATAPTDTNKCTRAQYDQRIHYPKTVFRVMAYNRSLDGSALPTPYITTGTGFVGYRTSPTTGSFLRAFLKSQPLDAQVVFGGGSTIAQAILGTRQGAYTSGSPAPASGESVTVNFPYPGAVPGGVYFAGAFRPGVCVVDDPGFTADHAASADPFVPSSPNTIWRKASNSLSSTGINVSQAANVVIADYPYLAGGRFSGTWTATAGGTVTEVSGSRLRITAAAGAATTATLAFPSSLLVGYRWLHLRVQSPAAFRSVAVIEDGTTTTTTIAQTGANLAVGANDIWLDVLRTTRNINTTAVVGTQANIAQYRRLTITVPAGQYLEIEYARWERRDSSQLSIMLLAATGGEAVNDRFLPAFSGFTDGMPTRGIDRLDISVNSLLGLLPGNAAQVGWTGTYFGPVAQSNTAASDLLEAGALNGLEPKLDITVNTAASYRGNRNTHGVLAYYGCGAVMSQGSYSEPCEIHYDTFVGSEVTATVIGDAAGTLLTAKNDAGTTTLATRTYLAEVYGVLTPDILQSLTTRTGADRGVSGIVLGNHGTRTDSATTFQWNATVSTVKRSWFAFLLFSHSPVCIDSPRQFLHWGNGRRIYTYHLVTMGIAYQSIEHDVDQWDSLCFDERMSRLFGVAKMVGSTQRRVYRSGDGGRHIEGVLTVDAKSAVIERDSERQYLVLVYQNTADDIIKRQVSRDGGTTWSTAENIKVDDISSSAAPVKGAVLSMTQDARATGVMLATVKLTTGATVKVIRSRDAGKNWQTVLS